MALYINPLKAPARHFWYFDKTREAWLGVGNKCHGLNVIWVYQTFGFLH